MELTTEWCLVNLRVDDSNSVVRSLVGWVSIMVIVWVVWSESLVEEMSRWRCGVI